MFSVRAATTARLAFAVAAVLATAGVATASAADPPISHTQHASYKIDHGFCVSFKAGYWIDVYAANMSCTKAFQIQKEYWLGPKSRKRVFHGGTGAMGYVLLKRYPGWKCTSGSGGGACTKGNKSAGYQN